jgi:DNA processing protein
VGARAATSYGTHVATDLAFGLADRGWTVVSGGAYGIDGAAHRGALSAGGATVAVLASGLDVVYPVGHANLFDRIGTDGLLISEWPPGSTPQRHRFLIRNRVIAAACRGTVVVEASARSGARNTARHTRELGRMLMAVPGPVTSSMSIGTNLLIRQDDARLVGSAAEVLEEVGLIGEDLAPVPRGKETPHDQLDTLSTRILDALPWGRPATVEELAVASRITPTQVRRTIPMLVMMGFAEETGSGYRLNPQQPTSAKSTTTSESPEA